MNREFEAEGIEDNADAGERHESTRQHRCDVPAIAKEIRQTSRQRNAHQVVDESPEEVLVNHIDGAL